MTATIFVFGSNLAGRHGKGAALHAQKFYGAIYGQGVGPQGQSYAIPTKCHYLQPLPLEVIARHVADFLTYARNNPELRFYLTPIGCGLAGFTPRQIAPMFRGVSENVEIPPAFMGWLT